MALNSWFHPGRSVAWINCFLGATRGDAMDGMAAWYMESSSHVFFLNQGHSYGSGGCVSQAPNPSSKTS